MTPLLNEDAEALLTSHAYMDDFRLRLGKARAHAEQGRQKYAWLLQ